MDHAYIQYLFPIPTVSGFHPYQPVLTDADKEFIRPDDIKKNLVLMAKFFGIFTDEETGKMYIPDNPEDKSDPKSVYFQFATKNLDVKVHNFHRISRMVQCLGIFGLYDEQYGLVYNFVEIILRTGRASGIIETNVIPWYWIDNKVNEDKHGKINIDNRWGKLLQQYIEMFGEPDPKPVTSCQKCGLTIVGR